MTSENLSASFLHYDAALWFGGTAAIFAVALILTSPLPFFDHRRIGGESVWTKPLKFDLSLLIHFLTLAMLAGRLSDRYGNSRMLLFTAIAAASAAAFEIIYIVFRASRQEQSHFNVKTPLATLMYGLMALGAVVLTAAAGILAVVIFTDGDFNGGAGLKWGSILGLLLGTVLTFVTAFAMGGSFSHHVGTEPDGARRMVITGWSLSVGDRRPAHFVATHMMQFLPGAGILADHLLQPLPSVVLIATLTGLCTILTVQLFRQANRGMPVFRSQARDT